MKFKAGCLAAVFVVAAVGVWGKGVYDRGTTPTAAGEVFLVRYEGKGFSEVVKDLESRKVVGDAGAFETVAKLRGARTAIQDGTYQFKPGMTMDEIFRSLGSPVNQMVRLPEGWWIARTAKRLEEKGVCPAEDYIELAGKPKEFKDVVEFELPEGSLEGYLYPDTYELPPLLGARGVIVRQLRAFESKVAAKLGTDGLERALIVGSMVETEAALDEERPMVAAVIENRLERNMRLQIDATVLYGLQEWRKLERGETGRVDSPYNTYRVAGLPPGPICSPSFKSIEAAMNPDTHDYLFYVRGEGLSHLFAEDYDQHRANIRKSNEIRKRELAEANQEGSE